MIRPLLHFRSPLPDASRSRTAHSAADLLQAGEVSPTSHDPRGWSGRLDRHKLRKNVTKSWRKWGTMGYAHPSTVRASTDDAKGCHYIWEACLVPGSRDVLVTRGLATPLHSARHAQSAVVDAARPRVAAGGSPRAK
jgi:hypothetical protein